MASTNETNNNTNSKARPKTATTRKSSSTGRTKRAAKKKAPRKTGYRVILDPANPPTHDVLTPENIRAAIRAIRGK